MTKSDFFSGLAENNRELLLKVPMSDIHNHFKVLYESGVKVTINTDDLLIFDSSIENEYLLLYRAGVLSVERLNEIRLLGLGSII